jgi:hypothetical protein
MSPRPGLYTDWLTNFENSTKPLLNILDVSIEKVPWLSFKYPLKDEEGIYHYVQYHILWLF